MAKLEITIAKDAYEALSDELKTFYTPTQDGKGYELEGVGSIQRALAEEKAKKTTKPELVTELEELRQFKAEQEAKAAEAEEEKLKAAGETDKWKEQYDARHKSELEKITGEKDALFADIHRERLTNELVAKGVLADRAAYLVHEMVPQTELFKSESGQYGLRKKGGIGDAAELDAMLTEVKNAKPFFFAANGASGSGASGSQGNGGNANTITAEQYNADPAKYGPMIGKGEVTVA